jgi:hypothetical protein
LEERAVHTVRRPLVGNVVVSSSIETTKPARLRALVLTAATVAVLAAPVGLVSVSLAQVTPLPPAGQPVLLAAVDTPPLDSSAALQNAVSLYKAGKYEESLTALQAIKADGLTPADQATLTDTVTKAQQATQLRRAARADFEMGQKALETGDNTTATNSFKNVVSNPYADEGTKAKAQEQLALVGAGAKAGAVADGDGKAAYDSAVSDFKAGNYAQAKPKFQALQASGYKAPWFAKSPKDYLEQIDKAAAGPGDAEQARAAYLTGRDQYRKGDWIAARQNFNKALALGYKPGFFEDAPSKYLERMDKKEQADAAIADKKNMTIAAAPVAVPVTDGTPTAVAPATPAAKPQPE